MRTEEIKIYKFDELSPEAKEKAINGMRYDEPSFAWDDTINDADMIGLKISAFQNYGGNEGDFKLPANEVAQNILNDHGPDCDTYKTAEKFMSKWQPVFNRYMETEEGEQELITIEHEFEMDLLENYRIMFNNHREYEDSDEYITDVIEGNEYEFYQDGTRYQPIK